MANESNGSDLNRRVSSLELAMTEMKDSLLVHALLEAKAASRIKEHAEFIASQQRAIAAHNIMMSEIEGKLNALIDMMMKRPEV